MSYSTDDIGGRSFEDWVQLFNDDPETFEIERAHMLDAVISEAPPAYQAGGHGLIEAFNRNAEGKRIEERVQIAMMFAEGRRGELESAESLFKIVVGVSIHEV